MLRVRCSLFMCALSCPFASFISVILCCASSHCSSRTRLTGSLGSITLRVCSIALMRCCRRFLSSGISRFSCGASLVLPSATPCADATLRALRDGCTVLYADAHTLRALLEENVHSHEVPALRGGLCKIGSGEAIGLGEPREFAGCSLATIGKPAPK